MFSTLYGRIFGRKSTESSFKPTSPLRTHTPTVIEEQDIPYKPPEFNTDAYRPVKVRCIGAGFSGILCALRYGIATSSRVCTVSAYMCIHLLYQQVQAEDPKPRLQDIR